MSDPSDPRDTYYFGLPLTEDQVRRQYEEQTYGTDIPWWVWPAAGGGALGANHWVNKNRMPPDSWLPADPTPPAGQTPTGVTRSGRPTVRAELTQAEIDAILAGPDDAPPRDLKARGRAGAGSGPTDVRRLERSKSFHGDLSRYSDDVIELSPGQIEQGEYVQQQSDHRAKLEKDRLAAKNKAVEKTTNTRRGNARIDDAIDHWNKLDKKGKDKWWKKFGKYIGKGGKWIGPAAALASAAGGAHAVATNWDNPKFQRALAMRPGLEKAKVWAKGISDHTLGDAWSEEAGDAWAGALDPWHRARQNAIRQQALETEQSILYPEGGVRSAR